MRWCLQTSRLQSSPRGSRVYNRGMNPVATGALKVGALLLLGLLSLIPYASAPVSAAAVGKLSVAIDPSSPAYTFTAGGTAGVTVGVLQFRAIGEGIALEQVALVLSSSTLSANIKQVYLYDDSFLVGIASFAGSETVAISTLGQSVVIPQNGYKRITVKADLREIGPGKPGRSGDLLKIGVGTGTRGTGLVSRSVVSLQGALSSETFSGVRVVKSYPSFTLEPLPTSGLSDGKLMRFAVAANAAGSVSIGSLSFSTEFKGADVARPVLKVFSDAKRTLAVSGGTASSTITKGVTIASFSPSLIIPAGGVYYFELRADTVVLASGSTVTTKLLNTIGPSGLSPYATLLSNGTYVVWSDNATAASSTTNNWTIGYGLPGISTKGFSQSRSGAGAQIVSATIDQKSLSATVGTPTITGTSAGVSTVGISIQSIDTGVNKIAGTAIIPVLQGRWAVTITPALYEGNYAIGVFVGNALLATGTLMIGPVKESFLPTRFFVASVALAPLEVVVDLLTDFFVRVGVGK